MMGEKSASQIATEIASKEFDELYGPALRQKGQKTMGFSKEDRARGVTSGELISCAPISDKRHPVDDDEDSYRHDDNDMSRPAPDREGELRRYRCDTNVNGEVYFSQCADGEWVKYDDVPKLEALSVALSNEHRLEREITTLRRQVEKARADAFEEAAKIADLSAYYNGHDESRCEVAATIAREIRALNSLKTEG